MSQTLSRHEAATDAGRESEASLDSNVPERQPTLDDVFRDLKSILARKDEEISRLTKNTPALEDALVKIERLEREIQKFHEQEISLKQQLEAKNKKIRAMKDAFKKAFEEATHSANSASSSEEEEDDDVLVLEEIPRQQEQVEQNLVCKKEPTELHVDDSLQGSQSPEMRGVTLVSNSADISSSEVLNAESGASAREPDGITDKSAGATSAVRRAFVAGEPEVEKIAPPSKRSKTVDSERPFQCDVCGRAYCRAEGLRQHQARECGSRRQKRVSMESGEISVKQSQRSSAKRPHAQLISLNNERSAINHEERPMSKSTFGESNASDGCGEMMVVNDSDDTNDAHEENMETMVLPRSDVADITGYLRRRTCAKEKVMDKVGPRYSCKCGKKYVNRCSLKFHIETDCGKPNLECKNCGKWFIPSTLSSHIYRNDCISKDNLRCKYCSFVAQDGRRFKLHYRICKQKNKNNGTQSAENE